MGQSPALLFTVAVVSVGIVHIISWPRDRAVIVQENLLASFSLIAIGRRGVEAKLVLSIARANRGWNEIPAIISGPGIMAHASNRDAVSREADLHGGNSAASVRRRIGSGDVIGVSRIDRIVRRDIESRSRDHCASRTVQRRVNCRIGRAAWSKNRNR